LETHPEVYVIIWSWFGQVSSTTPADIDLYLNPMERLEQDYPNEDVVIVQRRVDDEPWDTAYAFLPADSVSFSDQGLTVGDYQYRVNVIELSH
jgi:hypothetical protein